MSLHVISYATPHHELSVVAKHIIRERFSDQILTWKRLSQASEILYLTTCQRVLWIMWDGHPDRLHLDGAEILKGNEAWKHLLSLAAGLESANIGDREIVDQLSDALEKCKLCGAAGDEAQATIQDIIREAKRLRSLIGLADGTASVATAALNHLRDAMSHDARILLVGSGPITQYLGERLAHDGFKVALSNRTASKVMPLAERINAPFFPLNEIQMDPLDFDALVTSTSSNEPIFTLKRWEKVSRQRSLRIIDLALPSDSEPGIQKIPWVNRIDLSVFLNETETTKKHRHQVSTAADPYLSRILNKIRKRSIDREQKRHLAKDFQSLQQAWDALESEALATAKLSGEQISIVIQLLERGRTLSHRDLIKGAEPTRHLKHVAEILKLDVS